MTDGKPETVEVLAHNGVRLVKDHKTYARLCDAIDDIEEIATVLNSSCNDLIYSIIEADLLMDVSGVLYLLREEIDNWRSGKGQRAGSVLGLLRNAQRRVKEMKPSKKSPKKPFNTEPATGKSYPMFPPKKKGK